MNAEPGIQQPLPGTVSPGQASRRTFLKGAGLAGVADLAAPLFASTSARASTGLILGSNAGIYSDFTAAVPGARGCRSYRDTVITKPSQVPTTFPGEPGAKVVASIRPHPDALLSGSLDDAIKAMIANGAAHLSAPQLTVWHEQPLQESLVHHACRSAPDARQDAASLQ